MDDLPSFEEFNPIKFIYDLFFHMVDFFDGIYSFLTYEIDIPKGIDVGIWDYEIPFLDQLPDTLSVLELLGGSGITIVLVLALLKILIPMF